MKDDGKVRVAGKKLRGPGRNFQSVNIDMHIIFGPLSVLQV